MSTVVIPMAERAVTVTIGLHDVRLPEDRELKVTVVNLVLGTL